MAKWAEKPMGPHYPCCNAVVGEEHDVFCRTQLYRKQDERHGDPADHKWVEMEEKEDWLDADNWHSVNVMEGYYPLFTVLTDALNQAQIGKGADRHANGQPFTEQPVLTITRAVGLGFPLGQAMKKIQECQRMDTDAAKRELLGAINYLAAAILYLND